MGGEGSTTHDHVGPVLQAGVLANAIIAAIRDLNRDVVVVDRGAYFRVLAPDRCIVTRAGIEERLGRAVRFPGELETVMSAFKGAICLTDEEAIWQFQRRKDWCDASSEHLLASAATAAHALRIRDRNGQAPLEYPRRFYRQAI